MYSPSQIKDKVIWVSIYIYMYGGSSAIRASHFEDVSEAVTGSHLKVHDSTAWSRHSGARAKCQGIVQVPPE